MTDFTPEQQAAIDAAVEARLAEQNPPAELTPEQQAAADEQAALDKAAAKELAKATKPAPVVDDHALQFIAGSPGSAPAEDQTAYKGEHMPPMNGETWVILGVDDVVPVRFQGSIAAVIDPPIARTIDPVSGAVTEFTSPDAELHVRERSQGVDLWIPLSAVKAVSLQGRAGVQPFA